MKELEDVDIKAEMDEIMRSVEAVMKRVESVLPPKPEATDRLEE